MKCHYFCESPPGSWLSLQLCPPIQNFYTNPATWKAGFRAHHHHFSSSLPSSLYSRFYLCLEIRIEAAKFQVKVHHQSHFPSFPALLSFTFYTICNSPLFMIDSACPELLIDLQEKGGFLLDHHIPWFKSHECFFKNISNLEFLDEVKYVWQWTFKLSPASASLLSGIS